MMDLGEYYAYLLNGGQWTELPQLIESLTTNETYFFREFSTITVVC